MSGFLDRPLTQISLGLLQAGAQGKDVGAGLANGFGFLQQQRKYAEDKKYRDTVLQMRLDEIEDRKRDRETKRKRQAQISQAIGSESQYAPSVGAPEQDGTPAAPELLQQGSGFLSDGRFDADEKTKLGLMMMQDSPAAGIALMNQPKEPAGFTLGNTRFDGRGNKVVSVPPPPPKLTSKQLNLQAAGFKAGTPEYEQEMHKLLQKSGNTVNVGNQEKNEDKEYGKFLVENYGKVKEDATVARQQLYNSRLALDKLQSGDTGAFEPAKLALVKYLEDVGINTNAIINVSNAEELSGLFSNAILTKMKAQKGVLSEGDRMVIEKSSASLGSTKESNIFLIRASMAADQRQVEKADFMQAFRADKGTFDGAERAWTKHIKDIPMVGKHKASGDPVFFNEFSEKLLQKNPDASQEDIIATWKAHYGR